VAVGFHVCPYCEKIGEVPETSSGETLLDFGGDGMYLVPDMLPHYVLEHNYDPPAGFKNAVLNGRLSPSPRINPQGAFQLGWLGDMPTTDNPSWAFLAMLHRVLRRARASGTRRQTKGL
jgi:hypothetical protein